MTDYKHIYELVQIVDEQGTLKPLGEYKTNEEVYVGTQIAVIVEDDSGNPNKRLYFEVKHMLQFSKLGEVGEISQIDNMPSELQVALLIDEPIL